VGTLCDNRDQPAREFAPIAAGLGAVTRTLRRSPSRRNALAIVSTKDPAQFRTPPGGVSSTAWWPSQNGELNLDRTLLAMRRATQPKFRRESGKLR
jgi:hypothetical protein